MNKKFVKRYFLVFLISGMFLVPKYAHSTRYMWCWNNDSITNNIGTARADLYNFCAAPFGDTTKAITYLWYYAEGDISGNQANLRNFLSDAHSHGLKILYLDGNSAWVTSLTGIQTAESFVSLALAFNAATSDPAQRFDGVHYDVEPQSATNWNSNQTTYWSNFTALLAGCQAEVNTYNATYSPTIPFELDISRNWDIGLPVVSNTQVQNIVDAVAVMNYVSTFPSITTDTLGELTYGSTIGKRVVVGYDTGDDPPSSSTFYGLGDTVMEQDLAIATPVFSTYSSYQGIAIEYYDTYRNMFTSTAPTPGFYATPTSGAGPLTVYFTDTSGDSPTAWNWSFGDGSTSSSQNPTHIYADLGVVTSYSVTLIASNSYGTATVILPNYISLNLNPPTAGFYGNPTNGGGPLTVNFTDTSANNPLTWNWNFGDGSTATSQNPFHVYASTVSITSYTVTLIASNNYGTSTASYPNYITVSTTLQYSGGIIWDFDSTSTSPTTVLNNGYFYALTNWTTNNKGIGGSHALQITAPYETSRNHGGAIWLSNIPGWNINTSGVTANTINLINGSSTSGTVYFSILASNTTPMGIAFGMRDTTGGAYSFFIPQGTNYITDSTQLNGSISTVAFQQLSWDVTKFHKYGSAAKPDLSHINSFEWFFNTHTTPGTGSGQNGLSFYLDNVGAIGGTLSVELWNQY